MPKQIPQLWDPDVRKAIRRELWLPKDPEDPRGREGTVGPPPPVPKGGVKDVLPKSGYGPPEENLPPHHPEGDMRRLNPPSGKEMWEKHGQEFKRRRSNRSGFSKR